MCRRGFRQFRPSWDVLLTAWATTESINTAEGQTTQMKTLTLAAATLAIGCALTAPLAHADDDYDGFSAAAKAAGIPFVDTDAMQQVAADECGRMHRGLPPVPEPQGIMHDLNPTPGDPNAFYFVDMFQAVKGTGRQGVGWTPQQKDAVTALAVKYVCSDAHPSRSSFKQKSAGTTPTNVVAPGAHSI
jgi:Protein of unknown function (DUF732)